MTTLVDEIYEELDKKYPYNTMAANGIMATRSDIKDFLRAALAKALTQQQEEILKKFPKDKTERDKAGTYFVKGDDIVIETYDEKMAWNAALAECRKAVEGK